MRHWVLLVMCPPVVGVCVATGTAQLAAAGGPVHKGLRYYNSGVLVPAPAPAGPHLYSVTFTKPGTYTYWCVVHVPEGMKGTAIVQ
jgi:hypothetical protein